MRKSVQNVAAFIGVVTLCSPWSADGQQLANQCKVFLDKPVFTSSTTNISQTTKDSFRLLQCAANWSSASDAQSAGIGITVPIYDLPVPFTANWNGQKVSQWKSQNCSNEERNSQANLRYYDAVYSIDPVSAKAGLECFDRAFKAEVDLASNSALRCTLTETSAAYVFEARWRRTAGETGAAPKVLSFTTLNTSCQGSSTFTKGSLVSEGGTPILCLTGEKAAAFALVTDRGGCSVSGTVRLPKLKLPASLTLSAPMFMSGQEIELAPETRIITNGYPFSIKADKLTLSGNVTIQSFESSTPQSMRPGNSAGMIAISVGEVSGQGGVVILNAGQLGGAGEVGPQGPPGAPGRPGTGRTTNWRKNCPVPFVCDIIPSGCEGGQDGTPGSSGGQGYPGLPGMPGGAAGEVRVDVPVAARGLFSVLTNVKLDGKPASCDGMVCGGTGGIGGPGGPGGVGGQGGDGAPGTVYCGGTNAGPGGATGAQGPQGPMGHDGVNAIVRML